MNTATHTHHAQRGQIEHPERMGPSNRHALDSLAVAYTGALRLAEAGATLLRIEIGERNPVLWIARPPIGLDMPAGTKITRMRGRGQPTQRVMASYYHGCQVQWEIRS